MKTHFTLRQLRCAVLMVCVSIALPVWSRPAPLSIDALRHTHFAASLVVEKPLDTGPGFTAYLVSYRSAGLKVYAMVAVPATTPPAAGFPVLIANHGTHPNPPTYGISKAGIDSRPGDYYRSVPALYTARGFLVVMPDYRGHNISEGIEFARGFLASSYYTEDVLALLSALPSLEHADVHNVFMWGHSLGGEVTLRTLLATKAVKGAALWSAVGSDIWEQAYHYARAQNPTAMAGATIPNSGIDTLRHDIAEIGGHYDWEARQPWRHLQYLQTPVIIQQSVEDNEVPYAWSERLATELHLRGLPYVLYSYQGSDHFLEPPVREEAADRDATFFRSLMGGHLAQ